MKLFRYQNFIKESKEDWSNFKVILAYIDSICKKFGIRDYTINEYSTIDVDGDVDLRNKGLTKIPLKFGKVSGDFYCQYNQLESLEGSPLSVVGDFSCLNNKLISLEGSPSSVGGHFDCSFNQLKSLQGSPKSVGRHFYCDNNQLKSLEGISGRISGGIYCYSNQLRDVKGVKDGWLGGFEVDGNPVYEIFKLFPRDNWDEVIEILNEYEVIRDNGNLIILQRLEQVFLDLGIKVPEIEEIEGYKIRF
jgi:hypothetical protein